jgi:uncharacterized tellurite resistance protein B-like protein
VIGKLREMLQGWAPADSAGEDGPELDLAAAVLLVEIARADHSHTAVEDAAILQQLERGFGLEQERARTLLQSARTAVEHSVSLHEFTRALHTGMDYAEKQRVIEMLWRVALADQNLDKYEDYMIGRVGDLLYVSRGDVIRLKQVAIASLDPASHGRR